MNEALLWRPSAPSAASEVELRRALGATDADLREGCLTYPIVRFADGQSRSHTFLSKSGYMPARHHAGQRVTVAYDPLDPERAEVDSAVARWLLPAVLGCFGLVFSLVGVVLCIMGVALRLVK